MEAIKILRLDELKRLQIDKEEGIGILIIFFRGLYFN